MGEITIAFFQTKQGIKESAMFFGRLNRMQVQRRLEEVGREIARFEAFNLDLLNGGSLPQALRFILNPIIGMDTQRRRSLEHRLSFALQAVLRATPEWWWQYAGPRRR